MERTISRAPLVAAAGGARAYQDRPRAQYQRQRSHDLEGDKPSGGVDAHRLAEEQELIHQLLHLPRRRGSSVLWNSEY